MPEFFSFLVTGEEKSSRLDIYLLKKLPHLSRSFVKKIIESECVSINKTIPRKAGEIVRVGDEISVLIPEPAAPELIPEDIDIDILLEDESVAVIVKPAGLVVHPSYGHPSGTLVNALLARLDRLSSEGGTNRPGIVHRLDKETSGIMLVAKNDNAHRKLARQFSLHTISRKYRAILFGTLRKKEGEIVTFVGRHPKNRKKMSVLKSGGKRAVTMYRVVDERSHFSLVEFTLKTGRTHQIRVHAASLGHPVVGDRVYASRSRMVNVRNRLGKREFAVNRNLLNAFHIGFRHPESDEWMQFFIEDPDEFKEFWDFLR